METATDGRSVTRVRYETRRRELTVTQVTAITPHLLRVSLTGDFTGFQSLGFDDHIKLFFPDLDSGSLTLPEPGLPLGDGSGPLMRDYTPRRFDGQTLDIEFALHDAGPATIWAREAKVGDILNIGGPRGSMLIPLAYDSYVLIGDDTALPAIARRLEELPVGAKVCVVAEVDGLEDRLNFETKAEVNIHWVYRQAGHANCLNDALKGMHMPQGAVHVWVACESRQARLIRQQLIADQSKAHIGDKVFYDLVRDGARGWKGKAYSQKEGKTYAAMLTLDGVNLYSRECLFGDRICRSETWVHVN